MRERERIKAVSEQKTRQKRTLNSSLMMFRYGCFGISLKFTKKSLSLSLPLHPSLSLFHLLRFQISVCPGCFDSITAAVIQEKAHYVLSSQAPVCIRWASHVPNVYKAPFNDFKSG